jgi:uncharacterized damage-inducible protein DinB
MDAKTIGAIYAYDRWVNNRLLDTAESVPAERTREQFGSSFDSIHGTFAHMLGAQIVWLSRWKGTSPDRVPNANDFESIAAIRAAWKDTEKALSEFIDGLTDQQLAATVTYSNTQGQTFSLPLWQMMLHVVNHGTHHRSEIADMLTRVGHAPEATDMHIYFLEQSRPT